jgi:hypothetical protein
LLIVHAPVPEDWQAGPLTLRLSRNGGPDSGTAVMTYEVRRYRHGRSFVTLIPATRSDITTTAQEQKTIDVDITVSSNVTTGDWLFYFIQRLGTHASDTFANAVGLAGLVLEYTGVMI